MTFTVTTENIFVILSITTLIIQAWQVRKVEKIKVETEEIWQQIKILAVSTASKLEKLENKIDGKQDK